MAAAGLYGFSWYLTPVVFDRNKKVFNRKRNGKDELSFGHNSRRTAHLKVQ
jgi:hypothetical protein